jgi:peptide-methionine (S)-S-oxide reductase
MDERRFETATLAGGCWCLEAVFERLRGVQRVISGYAGGTADKPSYAEVCSGRTGHAEVVQVVRSGQRLGYGELLGCSSCSMTRPRSTARARTRRQRYRSAIYFHSAEQERVAREVIALSRPSTCTTLRSSPSWPR